MCHRISFLTRYVKNRIFLIIYIQCDLCFRNTAILPDLKTPLQNLNPNNSSNRNRNTYK